MNKKLLFFDIDGTLINSFNGDHAIPKTVLKRLRMLQEQGHLIFVASGRPKSLLNKEIYKGNFDGFILVNGAYVEVNEAPIYTKPMDLDEAIRLIDILEETNCDYILETANKIYTSSTNNILLDFFAEFEDKSIFVSEFDHDCILKQTLKIETVLTKEKKNDLIQQIETKMASKIAYDQHGTDGAVELYSSDINKSIGVQKILEHYHINRKDTYAFGDGINDIDLIKYCNVGVAMKNGVDELKSVADIVCDSVENDGLTKILDELFFS